MTNNKRPIVGRRYRGKTDKHYDKDYIVEISYFENKKVWFKHGTWLYVKEFWNFFEEIPETNKPQEDCPAEQAAEEWNTIETNEQPNLQKEDEVRVAMEELKYWLRVGEPDHDGGLIFEKAQNLLNALDKSVIDKVSTSESDLTKITRLEVIDDKGRSYVNYSVKDLELSYQDEGRTLKIFFDWRYEKLEGKKC